MEIRLLNSDDTAVLQQVAPDVFDNPIDPDSSARFLADPRHHIAVAIDDGAVIGMLTAVEYFHPDKPVELWINEVGIAPDFQRAGVGSRLIELMLDHGRKIGCREAWVLTEKENTAANGLYRSTGGKADNVVLYSYDIEAGPEQQ